jgi:hypothetical protein
VGIRPEIPLDGAFGVELMESWLRERLPPRDDAVALSRAIVETIAAEPQLTALEDDLSHREQGIVATLVGEVELGVD